MKKEKSKKQLFIDTLEMFFHANEINGISVLETSHNERVTFFNRIFIRWIVGAKGILGVAEFKPSVNKDPITLKKPELAVPLLKSKKQLAEDIVIYSECDARVEIAYVIKRGSSIIGPRLDHGQGKYKGFPKSCYKQIFEDMNEAEKACTQFNAYLQDLRDNCSGKKSFV